MSGFRLSGGTAQLTCGDFWSLVDLFSNLDKTKAFAAEIQSGLAQLAEQTKANQAESRRLVDLAVELEAKRQAIETADEQLLGIRQKFEAEKATKEALLKDERDTLDALRRDLIAKEGALAKLDERLKAREDAIIEADKRSQEAADQRTADLDAREEAIKAGEADLAARKAKLAAALGA